MCFTSLKPNKASVGGEKISRYCFFHPLTHRDPLVTIWTSQPVSTPAAVVATEVPIALAGAVEKPQRPPLSVVAARVRVLGSMAAVVCSDGDALPSSCAGAALVTRCPRQGWAALATLQPLGGDTLPGKLGQREGGTQRHHQETHSPHA